MKHKILIAFLFIMVTIAFVAGYFNYNEKIEANLNKVIRQDNSLEFNTGKENAPPPAVEENNPADKELKTPKLIGLSREEALSLIQGTKLKGEIIEEYSTIYGKGMVFWQSIPPNSPINIIEPLSYAISQGAKEGFPVERDIITVPSTIGLTSNAASANLIAKGFSVAYEYNPNAYDKGTVYSQNYKIDAKVPLGTTVIIRVSTGN